MPHRRREMPRFIARGLPAGLFLCSIFWLPAAAVDSAKDSDLSRLAHELRSATGQKTYQQLAAYAGGERNAELRAQAAFALGVKDFEEKRWAKAAAWFKKAQAGKLLSDYAALYLSRAEAGRGNLEAARTALTGGKFANSILAEQAQLAHADALVKAGRAGDALAALQKISDWNSKPALLFGIAQALIETGKRRTAINILQRVYFEFPFSKEAEPAKQRLLRLLGKKGREFLNAGASLWRKRADILWEKRAYIGAYAAYQKLRERGGAAQLPGATLRAAEALYFRGKRTSACRELKAVGTVPASLQGEHRALQTRCALRKRRWAEAEKHLNYLEKKAPGSSDYESALLAAAHTAWIWGERIRALKYFRQYVSKFPDSRSAPSSHWRLAWATYSGGNTSQAARLMEEHFTRASYSSYHSRSLYWRARMALTRRNQALARHLFQTAIEVAPRDYLAQQAQHQLRRLGEVKLRKASLPVWVEEIPARPPLKTLSPLTGSLRLRVEKAGALDRLGFWELADRELVSGYAKQKHPAMLFERARLASSRQEYLRAAEFARRAFPGYLYAQLGELPREAWEMLFPLPYWDLILQESRKQGIDPFLVAGLIRQESRFDKEAVSSAGALGLMQLMPRTARLLARNRRLSKKQIFQPETNIKLGVQYLAQLIKKFNGDVEKAVAAYNGGDTRVARWSKKYPSDIPKFVENIPLEQTRNFVYIVLRNHRFYRDLYEGASAPIVQRSRSSE